MPVLRRDTWLLLKSLEFQHLLVKSTSAPPNMHLRGLSEPAEMADLAKSDEPDGQIHTFCVESY